MSTRGPIKDEVQIFRETSIESTSLTQRADVIRVESWNDFGEHKAGQGNILASTFDISKGRDRHWGDFDQHHLTSTSGCNRGKYIRLRDCNARAYTDYPARTKVNIARKERSRTSGVRTCNFIRGRTEIQINVPTDNIIGESGENFRHER